MAFPLGKAPRVFQGEILRVPRNAAMSRAGAGCTDAGCQPGPARRERETWARAPVRGQQGVLGGTPGHRCPHNRSGAPRRF